MIAAILGSIVLLTLAFPTVIGDWKFPDLGVFVWIGWVPFVVAYRRRHALQSGHWGRGAFAVCFGYYLLSMYWLFFAMRNFGGLSTTLSVLVLVLLAIILALYGALAFFLAAVLERRARIPLLLTIPVLWALAEWARERFPLEGYPWSTLAYALGGEPYLMQLAEYIGVTGLVFLIMLVNLLIAEGLYRRRRFLVGALALVVAMQGLGYLRYRALEKTVQTMEETRAPLSVALIQGNISQSEKWDPAEAGRIRDTYRRYSEMAFAAGAELVIWPEAAYPDAIDKNARRVDGFQWLGGKPLLIGALGHADAKSYNSAFWLGNNGAIIDQVDKVHLVPFGEYVPHKEWFFFARALTQAVGDFYPGEKAHVLETPYGRWGILICYEDLFPDLSNALTQAGAEVLVNLTNDAWYEHSSAAYQHVVYSQFRALESRRYLLRATNTGVTAVIDPLGRVRATLPWFSPGTLHVPLWRLRPEDLQSLYPQVYPAVIATLAALLVCFLIVFKYYGPTGYRSGKNRKSHP